MSIPIIDDYLRRLPPEQLSNIERLCESWEKVPQRFAATLDGWFANFEDADKPLAHQLLLAIEHYGFDRFKMKIAERLDQVIRRLQDRGIELGKEHFFIVTPDGGGDSAHRHAYDLIKTWKLGLQHVRTIEQLQGTPVEDKILIQPFQGHCFTPTSAKRRAVET